MILKISSGWSKGKATQQQTYVGCGSCEGPLFREGKAGYLTGLLREEAVDLKVTVVGAGIGGLTAAIALPQIGVEVTVFERATELKEVGAGLLLAANAQKALRKLGLSEEVRRLGTKASAGEIRSQRGMVLARIPIDELEQEVGEAGAAVHRTDLQRLLVRKIGPKSPFAAEALVAVSSYPSDLVVLDGFGDGAVTVQDGPFAVRAGARTVRGSSVDEGDDEAYLHGCGASLR